jgi:2,4-dienoyl-CoA reductase-like NADH-dependent reductase (Old Yellow Enzyme family)
MINEVRRAVGPSFPVGIRVNLTDNLEEGLTEVDALEVVCLFEQTSIDLIDISGGSYFPGAMASSDGPSRGPYFHYFSQHEKNISKVSMMVTGGFKTREQALDTLACGDVDMVGLGRAIVLAPRLPKVWLAEGEVIPDFRNLNHHLQVG